MNKSNHSDDSNYDERPRYAEEHQNEGNYFYLIFS